MRERRNEEDISTEQPEQKEDPRFPQEDEHQRGTGGHKEAAGEGPKEAHRMRKREGLSKEERIRLKRDFEAIYQEGKRLHTPLFIIFLRRNPVGFPRIAAVAGKRVGGAVARNRVKRLIREFFRRHKERLRPSTDYLIIGKKGAEELKYQDVVRELHFLLQGERKDEELHQPGE